MNDFNNTRIQAEKTFVSSAILTEYGIQSFDAQYDFLLYDRILLLFQAYRENRSNPASIDLEALKQKISQGTPGEIELYIINKDGIVDFTTYKKDLKTDFRQFSDFFSSLTNIRQGNEFRSDPWIRDFHDPRIYWKYGYLPTDDHEYILEIGLKNANYSQMHKTMLTQLKKITREAMDIPGLIIVEVYDKAHRKQTIWSEDTNRNLSLITGILSGDERNTILNQTFTSKKSSLINNAGKDQVISVQYFNLSPTGSASGAELSYVGFLVFSTNSVEQTLLLYKTGLIFITILSLILGLLIAQYLSTYISRPIEIMTEDVRIIACSSLSHLVRATGLHETEMLRFSINHLVSSITKYISALEASEKALKTELVLRKKAENSLSKANKRMTQLSQITRHDILNQVTALQMVLEIIPQTKEKTDIYIYAGKAHHILQKITMLLSFTYDYEKIGQDGPIWQNIGTILDQNREEFSDQIEILHNCDKIEILADPLIKKVFYNLIDNTLRHGKTADTIRVFFEERKESGCLLYTDNGTGIQDNNKERIFERGFGRGTGLGMAFIREVLESNDIMIRETGIPGQGARFEITIPKDHYRIIKDGSE
jgi:signal transduction histidine kinase